MIYETRHGMDQGPQCGDVIFSVHEGGMSFHPASNEVVDVIQRGGTTTFHFADGASIRVPFGVAVVWSRREAAA